MLWIIDLWLYICSLSWTAFEQQVWDVAVLVRDLIILYNMESYGLVFVYIGLGMNFHVSM